MPPKKNRKGKKRKKKTSPTTTSTPNQTNTSSITTISNPHANISHPPPSSFLDFSTSDSDDPFDPYYDDYGYQDFDDYSNPFHPDRHDFMKDRDEYKETCFTFPFVEDLGIFERSDALMELPLDVFLHIISRLPIKPLAVCRCVCKTWGTIIHHPRFTKLYHSKLSQQGTRSTSILFHVSDSLLVELETNDEDNKQVFSEIFLLEHDEDDHECVENGVLVNPQFMPDKIFLKCVDLKFEVVGSCNGLICLAEACSHDPIYVCNPVIGEYMTLPSTYDNMDLKIIPGIGFDHDANEYKVVRLVFNFCDFSRSAYMEAEVCTLGSNKWRKLGRFTYPVFTKSSQVFVNGALHWTTFVYRELIVAFDVGKEEFNVIPPPPDFIPAEDDELHLGELGGLLCLFAYYSDEQCEVWTMKKYGVKESWSKDYVISRKVWGLNEVHFNPLKVMRNGDILLVIENQAVAFYDPRRKCFHKLKIRLPRRFDAITHVESFVSVRDFLEPTINQPCANTGEWFGIMTSVASPNPKFDIEGWKLNEQMRRLWWESH